MTKQPNNMSFFHKKNINLLIGCCLGVIFTAIANQVFNKSSKATQNESLNESELVQNFNSEVNSQNSSSLNSTVFEQSKLGSNAEADSENLSKKNLKEDEINVLSEELISVKKVPIVNETKKMEKNYDSVLSDLSGIKSNLSDHLIVEFWKTPLNSVGYKMSKNKLLLYGTNDNGLSLVKINGTIYLINKGETYILEYTNEFKRMSSLNGDEILARTN